MFVWSINCSNIIALIFKEENDINKTNASKEGDVCHYWYFLDKNFKYEPYLCNGCHDSMQKAMNFNGVAIVLLK